jgi:hypothetical protein
LGRAGWRKVVLPPAGEGWTEKEVVGEAAPIINYVEYELVVMLTVVTHAVNSVKLMEDIVVVA